jgi:hypothetical protein
MEKSAADGSQLATDRQDLLEQLPAFTLLKQLLPKLQGYRFGVGGSLLLCELGLLSQARDVDLVCVAADFAQISSELSRTLRPVEVAPHPYYQSRCFASFVAADGTQLDLMADIAVVQAEQRISWQFDQVQLQIRQGIPWMSAAQWLELYQLFQRPQRVALLQKFLQ